MFERKAKRPSWEKKKMSGVSFFPGAALPAERQRERKSWEAALVLPILFFVIFGHDLAWPGF